MAEKIYGKDGKRLLSIMWSILFLLIPKSGWTNDVVAVLSSDLAPYREALASFQKTLDHPITIFNLEEGNPKITSHHRVVVAFGGKAAQWTYPDSIVLIYCLAPGTKLSLRERTGPSIEIQMLPPAASLLSKMKKIQPALKRLAVFWSSQSIKEYFDQVQIESAFIQIEILSERLDNLTELPDRLRALYGRADALWLLPDPPLMNTKSFLILKEFSWASHLPLYVPTAGFVEKGALASISSSFKEIGRTAAIAAQNALSGKSMDSVLYPEKIEIIFNTKASNQAGLQIPQQLLQEAEKVLP
jgi:ABC transporter substrate binding protein